MAAKRRAERLAKNIAVNLTHYYWLYHIDDLNHAGVWWLEEGASTLGCRLRRRGGRYLGTKPQTFPGWEPTKIFEKCLHFWFFFSGNDLPRRYGEFPLEMASTPIVDIDPYYADKRTFIVINKGGAISRYIVDRSTLSSRRLFTWSVYCSMISIEIHPSFSFSGSRQRRQCGSSLHSIQSAGSPSPCSPPHVRLRHHHHHPRQL